MSDDQPSEALSTNALDAFRAAADAVSPREKRPGERFFAPLGEFILEFNRLELYLDWALQSLSRSHNSESGLLPLAYIKSVHERVRLFHQIVKRRFPGAHIEEATAEVFKAMKK